MGLDELKAWKGHWQLKDTVTLAFQINHICYYMEYGLKGTILKSLEQIKDYFRDSSEN